MEQTLDLMRKRHAYFSKLIEQNGIHTAQEFYDLMQDTCEMFGVDLNVRDGECSLNIECEGYDYEYYTISDGVHGGLATVSPIVCFQWWCANTEANIFEIDSLDNAV